MPLKIESLYYFRVLAETGSFTAAAEKLYLSQQALSNQIAQLEKTLGQELIRRSHGKVQGLTAAGHLLQTESLTILSRLQALENQLSPGPSLPAEICLRIGSILVLDTAITEILHTWSQSEATFRAQVSLPVDGPERIESQLRKGELDLGVLLAAPTDSELAYVALNAEPYLIVGAPGLRAEWHELRYIAYSGSVDSQDHVLNVWPERQWPRQIRATADVAMALELAQHSHFCLHIPRHFVDFSYLSEICQAPFASAYTPYLVWSANRSLPPLLESIKQEIITCLSPSTLPQLAD